MKRKLNLAALKQKQTEFKKKEMTSVRGGQSACACWSECDDSTALLYDYMFDVIWLGGGSTGGDEFDPVVEDCPCGSVFVYYGLFA